MGIEVGTALVIAAIVGAGATAYSAQAQSTAAKKAAGAQEAVGMAQIKAAKESEQLAADTASMKTKLKLASKTDTILTSPLGTSQDTVNGTKSLLGA
jgi:hypothetical protein